MWVWVQVGLIYGIGSWMWELGWRVVWGLLARKNRGREMKAGSRSTLGLKEDELRIGRQIGDETDTEATMIRPTEVALPTPLVLRTEPSVPNLAAEPAALGSEHNEIAPIAAVNDIKVDSKAKTVPPGEPSLQASALEVLTHLVEDNDAFEKTANEAFERLEKADL
jgi:hypothetical protein